MLLISAVVPITVTVPFVLLVEDTRDKSSQVSRSPSGYLIEAVGGARNNPTFLMILFVSTFLLTKHGVFDEYVPPLFQYHGFLLEVIAFLAVPVFLARASDELSAAKIRAGRLGQQLTLVSIGTISLFPFAVMGNYVGVAGLTIFFFAFGLGRTLIETRLQERIESDARATVTSIVGLGDKVGAIAWFLFFGLMAQLLSFPDATVALGVATSATCLLAVPYRRLT